MLNKRGTIGFIIILYSKLIKSCFNTVAFQEDKTYVNTVFIDDVHPSRNIMVLSVPFCSRRNKRFNAMFLHKETVFAVKIFILN